VIPETAQADTETAARTLQGQRYDHDDVRGVVKAFGFTAPIRWRGEEAKALKKEAGFEARRGVCERSHSGFNLSAP